MLESVLSSPEAHARIGRSWLRKPINDFLMHLAEHRYSRGTMRVCSYQLLAFGEFLAQQGVLDLAIMPAWIDPFVEQVVCGDGHRRMLRLAFLRFIHFLQQKQTIPTPVPPPTSLPLMGLVEDYLQRLQELRGLCRNSLVLKRVPCQALLTFVAAEGMTDLQSLRPETIHQFLAHHAKTCHRRTLRNRCSTLRDFLAYLHRRGLVPVNLAGVVVTPRVYQGEQCPRFLTRAEIDAVLAVIDRQTSIGRRDYAMVLLLAVYGLRAIEVVHLRLDDLDWRRQLLHIRRRKAGNNTTYPLSVPVGEAILAYLRQGRPSSTRREVFLSMKAPFAPLTPGGGLTDQVRVHLAKAGIRVERSGTHSFRYSCAQRLFEEGVPLKTIGDYLGHRDTRTTQHYTMFTLDQLREVALGDGEDLS
jgi:site-specific recombinase XerD